MLGANYQIKEPCEEKIAVKPVTENRTINYINPFSRSEEDIKITFENFDQLFKKVKVGDLIKVE